MLRFQNLSRIPGLRHGITTRAGGVSEGSYASLNLGFHVGDDAEAVRENRRLAGEQLGYDPAKLIALKQTHGSNFCFSTDDLAGCGAFGWEDALDDLDAIDIAEPNVPVLIQVADCASVLLSDGKRLSVVHAGWRGAVNRLPRQLAVTYPDTHRLLVGIGPCLCPKCLEVGPEVVEQVPRMHKRTILSGWEKPHLDLRDLIRRDLMRAGVPEENIEVMDRCPRCEPETFFSHRGQGGRAGRFGLVAWWE